LEQNPKLKSSDIPLVQSEVIQYNRPLYYFANGPYEKTYCDYEYEIRANAESVLTLKIGKLCASGTSCKLATALTNPLKEWDVDEYDGKERIVSR
jgi:hypothetical protein